MSESFSTNVAAVATHHPLATDSAVRMLRAGGNATDAAVAAMATLCVVVPGSVGLGGYGGNMIVYDAASRRASALDFDTRAPLEYRDDLYADETKRKTTLGYLSISVPAVIAGLSTALEKFGTKSWKRVTADALELAENGFIVDQHNRSVLEQWHASADELSRRSHFADGHIPAIGDRWIQKDLAAFMRRLADEGPDAFYRGDIARQIISQIRQHGGILSLEDLSTYEPTVLDPLRIDYRGHTVLTPPPPSGGITTLQILKTLESFDLTAFDPWSAPYLHLVAEVCKIVWPDRLLLGDPDFIKVDHAELLSAALASSRATQIRRHDIKTGVEAGIDDLPHTCNVSVLDHAGNLVSLTATQGAQFGSGVVIEGLGLVIGHGMSRFDYRADNPNAPAPRKRPCHNMCPVIVLKNDHPLAAFGLPGGTRIPTVTAQIGVSLIDFGATAQQAVDAPRVHIEGPEPLIISQSTPSQVQADLKGCGHTLKTGRHFLGIPDMLGGPANAIRVTGDGVDAGSSAALNAACVIKP